MYMGVYYIFICDENIHVIQTLIYDSIIAIYIDNFDNDVYLFIFLSN